MEAQDSQPIDDVECICEPRPDGKWPGRGEVVDRFGTLHPHEWCDCAVGQELFVAYLDAYDEAERREWCRMVEQNIERADIPPRLAKLTRETWPAKPGTEASRAQLNEWVRRDEIRSLYLYGSWGTGKSSLAAQTLRRRMASGCSGQFYVVADLLNQLKRTYGEKDGGSANQILDRAKHVDILVLDDIGAERGTEWAVETLFSIIDHRYNNCLEVIYTSNCSPEELAARLGERIAWRIVETAEVIAWEGVNFRDTKAVEELPEKFPYRRSEQAEETAMTSMAGGGR